jgi:hypothetical protein
MKPRKTNLPCRLLLLLCSALLLSNGSALAKPRGKAGAMPKRIRITVIGAHIGPGKVDGTRWDGVGKLSEEQVSKTQELVKLAAQMAAAAANPPGALAAAAGKLLGDMAMPAAAKPDVFGWVEWQATGSEPAIKLDLAPRSKPVREFSVTWRDAVELPAANWNPRLRIRVILRDKDMASDDAIGTVELNGDHIRYAWSKQKVTPILVADQSDGQLLAVKVSVSAAE